MPSQDVPERMNIIRRKNIIMKKISLENLNLKEIEQLSREQLKDVLGGWSISTAQTGGSTVNCNDHSGDPENCSGSCEISAGNPGTCLTESNGCYCG